MFKNVTIVSKIAAGFSILFVLLLGISALAFYSTERGNISFNQYRELAKDSVLAGRLQANMLLVRFHTKRFLKTGSEEDVREYNRREKLMLQFLNEASSQIQKPERVEKVQLIQGLVDEYVESFDKVVAYKRQRDSIIYSELDPAGIAMRKAMTDISESAFMDKDYTAAYYAGRIQEHLLLGRLYATKFLDTNQEAAVKRFKEELVTKIDHLATTMDKELQDPERRILFELFLKKRDSYRSHFNTLAQVINNRNDIVTNKLDTIGPVISKAAEEIKLSVKKDQDILGPIVKQNNEQTRLRILYICIGSLTVAILFGVLITQAVKKPIARLVSAVNDFGKGNLEARIKDESKNEIGILAKAFNTMADKVKAISQTQADLNWLSSSRVKFDDEVRGINEIEKLTVLVINHLSKILNAQVGAFYLNDGSNQLVFAAGYAYKKEDVKDKVFAFGEGLIGQAAETEKLIFLNNIPEHYIVPTVVSAIGTSKPNNVIIMPVMCRNRILGVIELGTIGKFSDIHVEFLNQIVNGIGTAINAADANTRLKDLLTKSEDLSEELQLQQEELKQANEELQESEAKLRARQEGV